MNPDTVVPHLYSVGAEWLLKGGIETLIDYHSEQEPQEHLEQLERCGFKTLVTNARGWTMGDRFRPGLWRRGRRGVRGWRKA